jgi:hypothetical protein
MSGALPGPSWTTHTSDLDTGKSPRHEAYLNHEPGTRQHNQPT